MNKTTVDCIEMYYGNAADQTKSPSKSLNIFHTLFHEHESTRLSKKEWNLCCIHMRKYDDEILCSALWLRTKHNKRQANENIMRMRLFIVYFHFFSSKFRVTPGSVDRFHDEEHANLLNSMWYVLDHGSSHYLLFAFTFHSNSTTTRIPKLLIYSNLFRAFHLSLAL